MSQYVQMEDAPPSSSRKMSSASTGGPQVHNALGTFNGCFIPCCLNILGIILFQRLAWAIGQAGISGHLKIGNNVQIGGGSGVIKNIPDNSKVMGYPAKDLKNFIRENK